MTESDLHSIIRESVKRIINEISDETVARAAGKSRELNDPDYTKTNRELGGEPQFKGKSDYYMTRKRNQAKYFAQQMDQREREFKARANYDEPSQYDSYRRDGGESVASYGDRMNKAYNQGRQEGDRQRLDMYKRQQS